MFGERNATEETTVLHIIKDLYGRYIRATDITITESINEPLTLELGRAYMSHWH